NSTRASRSFDDCLYASWLALCSAALGGGGTLESTESAKADCAGSSAASGDAAEGGGVLGFAGSACFSSGASERRSPSDVNRRRSVTVKPVSCFFSAMMCFLLRCQQVAEGKFGDSHARPARLQFLARRREFAPHVA